MKKANLDAEERDILESVERGEWRSVRGVKQEVRRLQAAARETLVKDRRINIRMSSKDLTQVQALAAREGLPYQTLISSIIHKYISGYLREERSA
jgi:predicted DNA binding CopG/RHH family protein